MPKNVLRTTRASCAQRRVCCTQRRAACSLMLHSPLQWTSWMTIKTLLLGAAASSDQVIPKAGLSGCGCTSDG